jgi:hypothetical protein
MTNFRIEHSAWNAPFSCIGSPFFGNQPSKKCPRTRLWALGSDKYDASDWMLRIMSDARKHTRLVEWWPMCGGLSEVVASLKAEAEWQHYHLLGVLGQKMRLCKIFCWCFLALS